MVLAKAGLLRYRLATCYSDQAVVRQLKQNGANYVDKKVVVEGRVVTANGPASSADFARAILEVLKTVGK
jgi:putative intracellular protease/amidase